VGYDTQQKTVAPWEDLQYSFNLVLTPSTGRFGLVICSRKANTDAELALVEAASVEKQESRREKPSVRKNQTDDLELTRQKNQKSFRALRLGRYSPNVTNSCAAFTKRAGCLAASTLRN
jgi:hypothetical protein